jgi:hypothetical protein
MIANMKPRSAPRVGIFFLVGRKLFIDSTPLDQAQTYGDHLIHESDHISFWDELLKGGDVADEDYEEHPRGRVAYDRMSGKFTLLADTCILNKKTLVETILKRMHLPIKDTDTGADSHYRCFRCLGRSR